MSSRPAPPGPARGVACAAAPIGPTRSRPRWQTGISGFLSARGVVGPDGLRRRAGVADKLTDERAEPGLDRWIQFEEMIERLAQRFPTVPHSVIRRLAHHEHEAMTGGALHWVPRELETGTLEQLERLA